VQYLEAKLILKPDRFKSVESFREFSKIVKRIAKQAEVGFTKDPSADDPKIREIFFFDTPDFALYRNAFILRRRISYELVQLEQELGLGGEEGRAAVDEIAMRLQAVRPEGQCADLTDPGVLAGSCRGGGAPHVKPLWSHQR
jgi:hypothetical protein